MFSHCMMSQVVAAALVCPASQACSHCWLWSLYEQEFSLVQATVLFWPSLEQRNILLLQSICLKAGLELWEWLLQALHLGGNKLPRWIKFLFPEGLYLYVPRILDISPLLLLWFFFNFKLLVLFSSLTQKLLTCLRIFFPRLCIYFLSSFY